MRSSTLVPVTLVMLALLTGCAAGDLEVAATSEVRDSAGIRIVESHRPRWGVGERIEVAAEPSLELGAVEGDTPEGFAGGVGVRRLRDGTSGGADGGAVARRRGGGGGYAGELRAGGRHGEIAGRHDRGGRWRRVPAQVLRCGGEVPAQCGAEWGRAGRIPGDRAALYLRCGLVGGLGSLAAAGLGLRWPRRVRPWRAVRGASAERVGLQVEIGRAHV